MHSDTEISYLDKIRKYEGIENCRAQFLDIYKKDSPKAADLLNDPMTSFTSFFTLLGAIRERGLKISYSIRNKYAIRIMDEIKKRNKGFEKNMSREIMRPVLKWMFETGFEGDGISDEYDEILDLAASELINTYKDKSIMPKAADLMFKRNRQGRYNHDLVWAFFRSSTPYAIKLVAERICSNDKKDIEFACELLNIDKKNIGDRGKRQRFCGDFIRWINENERFLYFTEENLQFSNSPALFDIDLERKYLNLGTLSYKRQPVKLADKSEKECLEKFKSLKDEEKALLSEYSCKIHDRDFAAWKKWIKAPVGEQIKIAKASRGNVI